MARDAAHREAIAALEARSQATISATEDLARAEGEAAQRLREALDDAQQYPWVA